MLTLRDYVNWGIAHSDNVGKAEGVPLLMEKCKRGRKMKQLEVYGESVQNGTPSPEAPVEVESVGELVTDIDNENYGKYKIPVTVRGKNLFDCSTAKSLSSGNSKYFTKTETGVSFTLNSDATTGRQSLDLGLASDYANKTISASFDIQLSNNETLKYTRFLVCDADGNNNTDISKDVTIVSGHYCVTTTLGSDYEDKHLALRLYISNGISGEAYEFKNIMVSESDTDAPFEPYIKPVTTNVYLNEPLRKIGDYEDYIDFKGKKVVRNTFMRVYDGAHGKDNPFNIADNESSWDVDDSNNFWQCTLSDMLPVIPKSGHADYKQIPICLQLPVKTGHFNSSSAPASVDKELIWYSSLGRNVRLFLSKDRFNGTYTGLCDYLKDNPISVLIATYEPYEEPIDCDLPILAGKTTVIDIDTSILPSNIKGKYIKR